MQQKIIENFKKNGIQIKPTMTPDELADRLGDTSLETLKNTVNEFYFTDDLPDVSGDTFVKTYTYSYALIHAFEYGLDIIEDSDIERAHNTALETVRQMGALHDSQDEEETVEASNDSQDGEVSADSSPEEETVEASDDSQGEEETVEASDDSQGEEEVSADSSQEEETVEAADDSQEAKVTKKSIIEELIRQYPDANSNEIVNMAVDQYPNDIKVSTARMYFYNIRNEWGLQPNGKRGRKPNGTSDKVKSIVKDNMDAPKADVVQEIMNELGLTKATSEQYYSKAKSELKKNHEI